MDGLRSALVDPLAIDPVTYNEQGQPSKVYVGETVSASVNPESGNITSVWKTRPSKAPRLAAEKGGKPK